MPQKTSRIKKQDIRRMEKVGFDFSGKRRCGGFVQIDDKANSFGCKGKGVEVMPTSEALKKYSWLQKYLWKAVDKNKDKYTKEVAKHRQEGYFIRAKKGAKVEIPAQACLYLKKKASRQRVHNIIIAEEGSSLHIITGCTTAPQSSAGTHIGISEFFVKKGAFLSFTMIHNWQKDTFVRPRTVAFVEKDGKFLSNYICLKEVKDLQMYPMAYLVGGGAVCRYNSILAAKKGTFLDVGSGVVLQAPKAKAEILSRAISNGGKIIARGKLIGQIQKTKAHLECKGLILNKGGEIFAIPELEGKVKNADLSHEAAVGKIADEEIEYLMARGIPEDRAISMIIRGFLNVDIKGLPESLNQEIKKNN